MIAGGPDAGGALDLLLRGAVAGLLLFHLTNLALPGPRPWARAALAAFVVSLLAYLVCQRGELLMLLPHVPALAALALCVSGTGWMWLAARGLFDDAFAPRAVWLAVPLGLAALGLAANVPRLDAVAVGRPDPGITAVGQWHALAMLGCTAAALWEVVRGWRDDLVEQRRVVRRWVGLGIGLYGTVALAVELALSGRDVGRLLPALHVAGIGLVSLSLALLVARRSLAVLFALDGEHAPAATLPTPTPTPPAALAPPAAPVPSRDRQRLDEAMQGRRLYRQEGLSLAGLAQACDMGEAPLRWLINQELGFRNFNDFLHHHRLAEVAPRLAVEDLPILSIALECGYGSIGPFNRAFRQRFGMTPTEWRAAARMQRLQTSTGDE
jgi:AraC-like DNA-binding protein